MSRLKKFARILAVLVVLYALFLGGLFWAMSQPPDHFGRIMKHVPMITMMVAPFESMWNVARGGHLNIGDPAPDFELSTHDHRARVKLSDFRGVKPVVLVFGSYT